MFSMRTLNISDLCKRSCNMNNLLILTTIHKLYIAFYSFQLTSAINAKKLRKTTAWERLEISSRKLEIPREHFMQMGSIKDRNGMDLTEAEYIKKRWQEYTEESYKKDLYEQDNHEGVITHTHLELDILECSQVGLRKHHYEQS